MGYWSLWSQVLSLGDHDHGHEILFSFDRNHTLSFSDDKTGGKLSAAACLCLRLPSRGSSPVR